MTDYENNMLETFVMHIRGSLSTLNALTQIEYHDRDWRIQNTDEVGEVVLEHLWLSGRLIIAKVQRDKFPIVRRIRVFKPLAQVSILLPAFESYHLVFHADDRKYKRWSGRVDNLQTSGALIRYISKHRSRESKPDEAIVETMDWYYATTGRR